MSSPDNTSNPDAAGGQGASDASSMIVLGAADSSAQGALTITPSMPRVTWVTGQAPPSVQFIASLAGAQVGARWSISRGEIGALNNSGLFTASGTIAGTANVTAAYGGQQASATITVDLQMTQQGDPAWSANPPAPGAGGYGGVGGNGAGGPPSSAQMKTLSGSPQTDATVSLLYPYDGTVWPRGLLAPLLQWNPGTHSFDSAYVHIQEQGYDYKGYFAANKMPFVNLPLPQQAWDAMTLSNAGDRVTISIFFAEGSQLFGPYTETWKVPQGTLKGTIYYNSYGTSLVKNSGTDGVDNYGHQYGAATLGIKPGATSPTLVAGINSVNTAGDGTGCRVCHTVSADGKSLVTQGSNASAGDYGNTVRIDLTNDPTGGAGNSLATTNLAFPALFKDGSLLLSSSGGMINGDSVSRLYAMPAGTPVPGVTGLPVAFQAALPAFSPDGRHVSFDFWAGSSMVGGSTIRGDRVSLGMIDFDGNNVFSNTRILYTPPSVNGQRQSVTFSSFLPSSAGIAFEVELTNPSGNWGYTWKQNTAELWWLDVASGMPHRLDQLNGYDASGRSYLPNNARGAATHSSAEDATLNYELTVGPVASGGYAWIVFTSRRMYGNVAELGPWVSDPRLYPWADEVTDKKLWVAAVDLNAAPGTDPSHPAFYLPGQELHAGNSRGFWSFDACRPEGMTCDTGDQCCAGYCRPFDGGQSCTSNAPACAALYDKCAETIDCCDAPRGVTCINRICSQSQPR